MTNEIAVLHHNHWPFERRLETETIVDCMMQHSYGCLLQWTIDTYRHTCINTTGQSDNDVVTWGIQVQKVSIMLINVSTLVGVWETNTTLYNCQQRTFHFASHCYNVAIATHVPLLLILFSGLKNSHFLQFPSWSTQISCHSLLTLSKTHQQILGEEKENVWSSYWCWSFAMNVQWRMAKIAEKQFVKIQNTGRRRQWNCFGMKKKIIRSVFCGIWWNDTLVNSYELLPKISNTYYIIIAS